MAKVLNLISTGLIFSVSACNQAPDDDPPAPRSVQKVLREIGQRQSTGSFAAHGPSPETPYQLQGALGKPRLFETQQKCEVARTQLIQSKDKDVRQLSKDGPLRLIPPVLVCFPV